MKESQNAIFAAALDWEAARRDYRSVDELHKANRDFQLRIEAELGIAACRDADNRSDLLAAAPDLLAALEHAHMALTGYLPTHSNAITAAAIEHARVAIAKATEVQS